MHINALLKKKKKFSDCLLLYDNYSNNASLLFPLLLKLMALDNKRANKCKGVLFFVFVKHRF